MYQLLDALILRRYTRRTRTRGTGVFALTLVELALLLLVPLAAVAGLLLLLTARRRTTNDPAAGARIAVAETAVAARRHAGVVSALAWGIALTAPPLVLAPTALQVMRATRASSLTVGVLTGLAPASAGLLFLGVHLIGELSWPRPTGTLRRAALIRRTLGDIVPRRLGAVTLTWAALLTITLVSCGIVATDGRSVTRTWPGGSSTASPFPGWFYGLPLLLATLVILVGTRAVLRLIAARPAVMDTQPAWDLSLRRLSAHRVLRGVQLVIGATTSGVLAVTSSAVISIGRSGGTDPATASGPLAAVGVALGVLAALVGVASIAIALVPGQPASAPLVADPLDDSSWSGDSGSSEPSGRTPRGPTGQLP